MTASILSGMTAGIGATLASQKFDVVKTVQQASTAIHGPGFFKTIKMIHAGQGYAGFFKGVIPRGLRVMSAVTLMSWMNAEMESLFQKRENEKPTNSPLTK